MRTLLSYGTGKIFATGLLPMACLPTHPLQPDARNDDDRRLRCR